MASNLLALPTFVDSVDYHYFLEPLRGATGPKTYLDRFPDALYHKSPDSHFMHFMFALFGPAGIGSLRRNLLEARLELEAHGLNLTNIEKFYGDPFTFGRILDEFHDFDITGLLPVSVWNRIRAQDEAYRSRALQFFNGARLGTSPQGMRFAAMSGTGQNVDIVENYKYLFDIHSDDPLGLRWFGFSGNLGEFSVLPRPVTSRSQVQTLRFDQTATPLGTYTFALTFNGYTTPQFNTTTLAPDIQVALQNLPSIGLGNVTVTGGPAPSSITITFTGKLSNQTLPPLVASFLDTYNIVQNIPAQIVTGAVDVSEEAVVIGPADQHHTQEALDRLRPVASYPTFSTGRGLFASNAWSTVTASTEFAKVVRFVTGASAISWPPVDNIHWIQPSRENEAPQLNDTNLHQHYINIHNVAKISGYTDDALADPQYLADTAILPNYTSVHVGAFPEMDRVLPFFRQFMMDTSTTFSAERALPAYLERLQVTNQFSSGLALINDVYPADYLDLPGIPKPGPDLFWSSAGRPSGAEILEIDLGSPQAVNYLSLEITKKPLDIEVTYDLLDQAPQRNFIPIIPINGIPTTNSLFFDPSEQSPWRYLEYHFDDGTGLIFTRFIRIKLTRRNETSLFGRFLFDPIKNIQTPWSIEVRNLRIGRNISPGVIPTGTPPNVHTSAGLASPLLAFPYSA